MENLICPWCGTTYETKEELLSCMTSCALKEKEQARQKAKEEAERKRQAELEIKKKRREELSAEWVALKRKTEAFYKEYGEDLHGYSFCDPIPSFLELLGGFIA